LSFKIFAHGNTKRKNHRQKTCGKYGTVFPYGGIIRIRLSVGIIVKNGFPLSLSFIKLPNCKKIIALAVCFVNICFIKESVRFYL
jgi:hypothetical protein